MQLILCTETSVDIKAKMSLIDDNLEKSTMDNHSAVANGDVANGDLPNDSNGARESNKKIEQVKQNPLAIVADELEQVKTMDGNNSDIETSQDNELNQAIDIVNGKDNETVEVNPSTELANAESEHINNDIAKTEVVLVEEVRNDKVNDSIVTKENHENSTDIEKADANENVTTEKENTDIVDEMTKEESTVERIAASDIADIKQTMEIDDTVKTEVELEDEVSAVTNISDATESVTIEKENNDVDLNTETDISNKNAAADITVDYEENSTTNCNVNYNENASSNNTVDNGDVETVKKPEENQNVVNIKIKEKETDSVPIENIISEGQERDIEMMPEKEGPVNTTDSEDRKDIDESVITEMSDIEVQKENVLITDANSKKEQNIPVSAKQLEMETDEIDTNNKNINLTDLNHKKENVDIVECVKKALEEEERQMLDIEEKEYLKTANDDTRKLSIMDVDESAENVPITLEANSKTSLYNLSDVNKTSENTVNVDCSINEPISVQKDETVDLIPDSSDDVIFNLDDDKEHENETVKRSESESTKIIEEDNKTVSGSDDDKKENDYVPKESDEIIDLDENVQKNKVDERQENTPKQPAEVPKIPPVLKLSNTLDILSDEEDEPKETDADNKCISIEDDDDVMLIDEDTCVNEKKTEPAKETEKDIQEEPKPKSPLAKMELNEEIVKIETEPTAEIEATVPEKEVMKSTQIPEKIKELSPEKEKTMPLLHEKFLKTCKKNLSEMTREELEEFCISKIVESVIDRSSLSEVKTKLKTLTQNVDEYNKKAKMLTKQNRDLQVVLKSIQEDQKKGVDSIVPLKITRSVGMQVLMTDKVVQRRKGIGQPANAPVNKQIRNPVIQSPRPQKQQVPQIPVPRLVPANNPTLKSPNAQQPNTAKITSPLPNGVKTIAPVQKGEKRTHNRIQSVTVDLTDDEPPAKVVNRAQAPAVPPVRLVPSQNLLAPPRPSTVNSPRKVYIPISGPQGQNVRPGQTIMLKTVPNPGPRQRCPPPHMVRMPQNVRIQRPQGLRHPAPLPDCMKQYQPPNWKALPPAPDLKLAKVENGIVISWKIEGYQEDSYEEIASYQLYAYQETASPPNTALWKKIGDVKALPLPMACTLTQFMAGYKYYFAVRAVDIRSRLGPFSLPGSILLLNKM